MFGLFKKKINVEEFIAASLEGLRMATQAHQTVWHLGTERNWNIDQDEGTIVFTFEDGSVATAPVQIVGTYDANDGSFLWGWEHPSVLQQLQQNANQVKEFGELNQVADLVTHKIYCTQERAWEYTALAMRLSESSGAYRANASETTFVYMTFGSIQLSKS